MSTFLTNVVRRGSGIPLVMTPRPAFVPDLSTLMGEAPTMGVAAPEAWLDPSGFPSQGPEPARTPGNGRREGFGGSNLKDQPSILLPPTASEVTHTMMPSPPAPRPPVMTFETAPTPVAQEGPQRVMGGEPAAELPRTIGERRPLEPRDALTPTLSQRQKGQEPPIHHVTQAARREPDSPGPLPRSAWAFEALPAHLEAPPTPQEPAAPRIQVRIGRVDVRVTRPTAVAQPAPHQGQHGFADYALARCYRDRRWY
jgi:hypothetical protein